MRLKVTVAASALMLIGTGAFCSTALAYPVAPPLETFAVPATGATRTSTTILQDNVQYWILATGTYNYGGGHLADAEWSHTNHDWQVPWGWYEYFYNPPWPSEPLDLYVDEQTRDWWGSPPDPVDPIADFPTFAPHTYSPTHTYWLPYMGEGAPVSLRIFDTQYYDNSGSLQVGIYGDVPEPATLGLLALGGLVTMRRR